MKRKTNPVEAAPLPTCTAVGPEDSVLIACVTGEAFLVERNCAFVSGYCRDVLQMWDGAVRRAVVQTRHEESAVSEGVTVDVAVVLRISADTHRRDAGGPLATDPTEIPFMAFCEDDDAAAAPLAGLQRIPVTVVAEHFQQRLEAAEATTPTKVDRPSSKPLSSYGERKGAHVLVPKPISPLSPMEGPGGELLYPVVVVPHLTAALMELALSYAQKKYKIDVDGERAGAEAAPPVQVASAEDRWRLIAASVLSGM
ncbi:hypothetical protein NESM_000691800 [Novymonas esmeraldas]|uniref:Uncharacterized protein n=1 Tax=Novymonas esmeraldas TaxID=1808958 RepID=A0AAW0EXD2_9TRYP